MSNVPYRTKPVPSTGSPTGIPYIIGNEAAERFSYYGMRGILVVVMTQYLMSRSGDFSVMNEGEAKQWYHMFVFWVYLFPIFGSLLSDIVLGKYKTIIGLSLVYCLGHLALALDETRLGLTVGLTLIAIGAGGIKPCVSAHLGDQFGQQNQHLLSPWMNYFYFSINLGGGLSMIATPWLLDNYGPSFAFGLPGLLMMLATFVFWWGRNEFVHVPPSGKAFFKEALSREGMFSLLRLAPIFLFVAVFWSLYDQSGSAWVLQAAHLNLNFMGIEWLPAQIQVVNPLLVMLYIYLADRWIYPFVGRFIELTPLRKIGVGFFMMSATFLLPAWIETQLASGEFPSVGWQLLAFVIITMAEVLVSVTVLEFSYTQATPKMKSVISAAFLFTISAGNFFTAQVNKRMMEDPPSFTPDVVGEYELELVVSDYRATSSDRVLITVVDELPVVPAEDDSAAKPVGKPAKRLPKADAGQDQATSFGTPIRLYGSANHGDYRGRHSYQWTVVGTNPPGYEARAALEGADTRTPVFSARLNAVYTVQFAYIVGGETATDQVLITVGGENHPPVSTTGEDQTMILRDEHGDLAKPGDRTIVLDGTGSYDPDGNKLTYGWRFTKRPASSQLTDLDIVSAQAVTATSKLEGPAYYLFFAKLMLIAAVLFIPVAVFFKPKNYLQDGNTTN